jgi:hypothetical protein
MPRFSRYTALAVLMAVIVPSGAYARVNHTNAVPRADAHNSLSDMDIRKHCYEEARLRWPSSNQEMQTNRDFTYRTCAFDHGVRNP